MSHMATLDPDDRIMAGFLGGVLGDALGEPVEFLRAEERLQRWGKEGVQDFIHPGQRGRFMSVISQIDGPLVKVLNGQSGECCSTVSHYYS